MAVGERPEQLHHKEAFEFYYAMGKERNLRAISEQFDVALKTVQHWSHWYRWRDRIQERENEVARRLAEEAIVEAVKDRRNYARLIKAMITRGYEKFKEKDLEPSTVTDLINLVRLEIALTESTDDLTRRMGYQGPSVTRELTMKEVITGGTDDGYDERLARRISETVIEYTAGPIEGDGGEDEFGGMADGQEGPEELMAPDTVVRDSGGPDDTEGLYSGPPRPLQIGDIRGEPPVMGDTIQPGALELHLQPDEQPSGRPAGEGGGGDEAGGAASPDEPPALEHEGQDVEEWGPSDDSGGGG